ncbi:hypothetical protein F383_25944 [Gossypium arboreum]|uniref:Uncharacterized protein n=1 Tax=Gossypium arboreum TaxID=29729 RepID=A0A0B0MJ82_GOSAR|nr:hypothetical protein F383_25944 [Gossypium arboreum]
MCCRKGFSPDK